MRSPGRSLFALLALAAAGAALAGCEPEEPADLLAPARVPARFTVVSPTTEPVIGPTDGVTVSFSATVDRRTVGSRSVRVLTADGTRFKRVHVSAKGEVLHVRPSDGHAFPAGERLVLRIEGPPSLRALRSADGDLLDGRHEIPFTVDAQVSLDLVGPALESVSPAPGAAVIAPGSHFTLHFSEPISHRPVRRGRGVALRVDGRSWDAVLRLSRDRRALVVRPAQPLPPNAEITLDLDAGILDSAGNPFVGDVRLEYRTRADSLHELTEDFEGADMADPGATNCRWAEPSWPGELVWGAGSLAVGDESLSGPRSALPLGTEVTFHVVYPADQLPPQGFASGLRLEFEGGETPGGVVSVHVRAGPTFLEQSDPTFAGNEQVSALATVARVEDGLDVEADADDDGGGVAEIPFDRPLMLQSGSGLLVEVDLVLAEGVRLSAVADPEGRALVLGHAARDGALPVARLLVTGGRAQARSLWYDSASWAPDWHSAVVEATGVAAGARLIVEFQTAPGDGQGRPDAAQADRWVQDLADALPLRFVRYRVRFEGAVAQDDLPRVDRIVLPYVTARRAR